MRRMKLQSPAFWRGKFRFWNPGSSGGVLDARSDRVEKMDDVLAADAEARRIATEEVKPAGRKSHGGNK